MKLFIEPIEIYVTRKEVWGRSWGRTALFHGSGSRPQNEEIDSKKKEGGKREESDLQSKREGHFSASVSQELE